MTVFKFHRWRANLRILDVSEIKTVPHVPLSHPFVQRLLYVDPLNLPAIQAVIEMIR